jgi:hypothetical protein
VGDGVGGERGAKGDAGRRWSNSPGGLQVDAQGPTGQHPVIGTIAHEFDFQTRNVLKLTHEKKIETTTGALSFLKKRIHKRSLLIELTSGKNFRAPSKTTGTRQDHCFYSLHLVQFALLCHVVLGPKYMLTAKVPGPREHLKNS